MMMVHTHTRILGIAPYEGMRTVMERTAEAYPNVQLDVYTGDLEEGVAIVQHVPVNFYDCIISRGGTATLIRQMTELPVVEIPLSVYDVLSAMKLAENYSSLYAIVGFSSITGPAHTLCDLLGYHLNIRTVQHADEVPEVLKGLRKDGYRMVVCDMVTHRVARQMGMDAFLITSGVESMHAALDQAINISQWFGRIRQENTFLRSITQDQKGRVVVLRMDGQVFYSSTAEPSSGLLEALRMHLKEVPPGSSLKFYYTERDQLYRITAQMLLLDEKRCCLFYCVPSRISMHCSWGKGIRAMNKGECEYLFTTSFYNTSGAMGNMAQEIRKLAEVRQPVMIKGEAGTGKEQIAWFLYLHSPRVNKPFILVDCELVNEKGWDFLLWHNNSPLNATGNTIYFQNFEAMSEELAMELLAVIHETGLARRVRLIFSYICQDGEPMPERMRKFQSRLGCLMLDLPSLRSRVDEISSLASVYLNSLTIELGKQISGFEPRAIEMLQQYDWPNNYTQFKYILRTLATTATSSYIRGSAVAELLAKERPVRKNLMAAAPAASTEMTLEEMIQDIVEQAVDAHGGNRAAAARQLGISRTTLWRYLNKREDKEEGEKTK